MKERESLLCSGKKFSSAVTCDNIKEGNSLTELVNLTKEISRHSIEGAPWLSLALKCEWRQIKLKE